MTDPAATPRQVVVITGVTKGLGRALAVEMAGRGLTVAGCGRTEARIAELREQLGDGHILSVVDVAVDAKVKTWAADVLTSIGPPDILVNCAGLINRKAPLWKVTAEEFGAVVDVNVKGTANTIRHFVPRMVDRQRGLVVNFSSGWGRSAAPEVGPYCASKWAVEGLTRSLARELPHGCVAVSLNPGIINTGMLQTCFGASAHVYPLPDSWAKQAASVILSITERDNGTSMNV